MVINSSQGANTYTNAPLTTPPIENTQSREQNLEAAGANLNSENTAAAQSAFKIDITPEAQDRLAAENNEEAIETQAATPESQPGQNNSSVQGLSQIVNIVA